MVLQPKTRKQNIAYTANIRETEKTVLANKINYTLIWYAIQQPPVTKWSTPYSYNLAWRV